MSSMIGRKRKYPTSIRYAAIKKPNTSKLAAFPARRKRFRQNKFNTSYRAITSITPLRNTERSVVPSMMQTTFPVHFDLTQTLNINLAADNVYKGNDIYDPDTTGVGTRANGNYEWSSLYGRAKVIGSRITVKFTPGSTFTGPCFCSIIPNRDATALTGGSSASQIKNHPGTVSCILDPYNSKTLVLYTRTATMFGTRTADDVAFSQAFNAVVGNPFYYHVCCSGFAQNDIILCNVTIEYFTVMYKPLTTYPSAI